MIAKYIPVQEPLYEYMCKHSVRKNSALEAANQYSLKNVDLTMQSLPEVLNFLQWLIGTCQLKSILELGTFTGVSALAMAQVSNDINIITCDNNPKFLQLAEKLWQKYDVNAQIEAIAKPATDACEELIENGYAESFDMVFIDANKKDYPFYYELAYNLVRRGGIIVVDNVFLKHRVIDNDDTKASTQGVRLLNQLIKDDSRVKITSIPLADGLTLATKI